MHLLNTSRLSKVASRLIDFDLKFLVRFSSVSAISLIETFHTQRWNKFQKSRKYDNRMKLIRSVNVRTIKKKLYFYELDRDK